VHPLQYKDMISRALAEDLFYGDRTTESIFSGETGTAQLLAREEGITAGMPVAAEVFAQIDSSVVFSARVPEGSRFAAGEILATVTGPVASILKGERTALNFLQRLCGIATLTAEAVQAVAGTKARIVDTRKTTPGLRLLEKYAVRMGGGENHRLNLADMVMIKDNHIQGAGSIMEAVARVRKQAGFPVKIEVEAAGIGDVTEALACGVDVIMLDNMSDSQMRECVEMVAGRALVEASGGITAGRLRAVADTGVDLISLGYLTHGYRALDLSLKLL
jgi:nicotinate-nucleotide pyrophosphorylase (carboxylating)